MTPALLLLLPLLLLLEASAGREGDGLGGAGEAHEAMLGSGTQSFAPLSYRTYLGSVGSTCSTIQAGQLAINKR